MKKTLMVLSFALCASFAFAQTATPRLSKAVKHVSKTEVAQNDLSKALFTKDATPLLTVDFHDGTSDADGMWTGTGYNTGVVTSGLERHGQNYAFAKWRRWPNVEQSTIVGAGDNTMSTVYSFMYQNWFGTTNFATRILSFCDTANTSAGNGFMMMSMIDQQTDNSGNFNAYIQLSNVDATTATVLDVQFYQYYRKFYDFCYIDYKLGDNGTWTAMEINVTGVDIEVNGTSQGVVSYTLPLATAGQNGLGVRIRYISLNSHRSNAYGYFWIIDDVSILSCDPDRLIYYPQEFVEGNYGMIPQGLEVIPAWYGYLKNNGSNNQTNLTATLTHLDADQAVSTEISTFDGDLHGVNGDVNGTINAGDSKGVICDPYGWIFHDSIDSRGWFCYGRDAAHGTGIAAIPTATTGDNYLYAQVTTGSSLENTYDTMYYSVNAIDNTIGAARWAHDNGVLVYSPYNYYIFGYIMSGGNWYVSEDPEDVHYYEPGYSVTTQFNTTTNVPENWAIRGVEMVASPARDYHATGTKISPVLYWDSCEGSSVYFRNIETGAGIYTVKDDDINDSTVIGRNSNGYLLPGNYNTIRIMFPEQPALEAGMHYRAGYSLEEEGYFALAAEEEGYYRLASPTRPDTYDTILYFRNDPATKKYAHRFPRQGYQNTTFSPNYDGNDHSPNCFAVYYYDAQPMIHLLVGPAQEVARVNINVECDSTDYGYVAYGGSDVCGTVITPVQGSSPAIRIIPMEGCEILSFSVDGNVVTPFDEATETGDENYTSLGDGAMQYRFNDLAGDHTIHAIFKESQISIDPVAANVRMNLQPNPATSQVSLSVEGVAGMVNCAIIDMSGRVVFSSDFNAENTQVISLSNLAKGAYFVRITNNNFSKVEKLIVR